MATRLLVVGALLVAGCMAWPLEPQHAKVYDEEELVKVWRENNQASPEAEDARGDQNMAPTRPDTPKAEEGVSVPFEGDQAMAPIRSSKVFSQPTDGQDMDPVHKMTQSAHDSVEVVEEAEKAQGQEGAHFTIQDQVLLESEHDVLPERTEATDMMSLLSMYGAKVDDLHSLSHLAGKASKYPRVKRVHTAHGTEEHIVEPITHKNFQPANSLQPRTEARAPVAPRSVSAQPPTTSLTAASNASGVGEVGVGEHGYAFECNTHRRYDGQMFSLDELIALQADVCHEEEGEQWNPAKTMAASKNALGFAVNTANFMETDNQKAATLAVRVFMLQPFGNCNRKTATCAALNLLENSGRALKKGTLFWDFKVQLDNFESRSDIGAWDPVAREFQLKSASKQKDAIDELAGWLDKHTTKLPVA